MCLFLSPAPEAGLPKGKSSLTSQTHFCIVGVACKQATPKKANYVSLQNQTVAGNNVDSVVRNICRR